MYFSCIYMHVGTEIRQNIYKSNILQVQKLESERTKKYREQKLEKE